jgi:hypothetical protein
MTDRKRRGDADLSPDWLLTWTGRSREHKVSLPFTIVFAWLLLGEALTVRTVVGVAMMTIGTLITLSSDGGVRAPRFVSATRTKDRIVPEVMF